MKDEWKFSIVFVSLTILLIAFGMHKAYSEIEREEYIKLEMVKGGANPMEVGCAFVNSRNHTFCMNLLEGKRNGNK